MPIPDLDYDFNETDRAVKETAHRFAAEVMRPVGEALDKLPAADVIAQQSAVWDVFAKFQALGLNDMDPDLSPLEQLAARELVDKLLEGLPPRDNLVVTMLYLEGHTLEEIQKATGWTVLAIKLLSFRARKKMKKALKHLLQEGSP